MKKEKFTILFVWFFILVLTQSCIDATEDEDHGIQSDPETTSGDDDDPQDSGPANGDGRFTGDDDVAGMDATINPWMDYQPVDCGAAQEVIPSDGFVVPGDRTLELIDGGFSDLHPPAALWDSSGAPTVWTSKAGFLARYRDDGTQVQVNTFGFPADCPAGAVGTDGRTHLAYADREAQILYHLEQTATGWQRTPVDCGSNFESFAIDLDATGAPHIAYSVDTSGKSPSYRLYHATRVNGTWLRLAIDNGDVCDNVRIDALVGTAFPSGLTGTLYYITNRGGDWTATVVTTENEGTAGLDAGQDDRLYAAYIARGGVMLATFPKGTGTAEEGQ